MTLKREEVRAQERAIALLSDLANPDKTKRIPPNVRLEANSILRHLAGPDCVKRGSINGE